MVLSAAVGEFAVLAADRLIGGGGDDDKLIIVGPNCAVACMGTNPAGVYVPDLMRAFAGPQWTATTLAHAIANRINRLTDKGAFGVMILGLGPFARESWFVSVGGGVPVLLARDHLHASVDPNNPQPLDPAVMTDPQLLQQRMLKVYRYGAHRCPLDIGPPFDLATLSKDGILRHTRFPS